MDESDLSTGVSASAWQELARKLHDELEAMGKKHPDLYPAVIRSIGLVRKLEQQCWSFAATRIAAGHPRPEKAVKTYRVAHDSGRGVLLEELATGTSPPKMVTLRQFDAAVKVIGSLKSPLTFTEIFKKYQAEMGGSATDPLRVAIRFMRQPQQEILDKRGTRYVPKSGKRFSSEAKRLWKAAEKSSPST